MANVIKIRLNMMEIHERKRVKLGSQGKVQIGSDA